MNRYGIRFPIVPVLLFSGLFSLSNGQSCLKFVTPVTLGMVKSPVCTVLVEDENCPRRIRKIEFTARYFPEGSDSAAIISLGSVSRSPYMVQWDISGIPNQLFTGVSIFAEATMSYGETALARREGVFFLHQNVQRPNHPVSYDFPGVKKTSGESIELPAPRSNSTVSASVYWNERELVFIVNLRDPRFTAKVSRDLLQSMGIEVLLDPFMSRKPFPGKDVFIYSVPLTGKPFRTMYKPVQSDSGTFSFETSNTPCEFEAAIVTNEQEGFSVRFPIPVESLGSELPETIGCNLVLKSLSDENRVVRTSWIKASLYETYSPCLWGELQLHPRPLFMNRPLIAGLLFGAGFFLTLLVSSMVMLIARPSVRKKAVQSEADRQEFAAVKESIDSQVIGKNVSADSMSKALSMTPKKLTALIRRATGMSFGAYVMYARIEIAKERLRSSHCTEESIAQTCGFHSVHEMEKFFMKFYRITPSRFRTEQQVV